MPSSSGDEEKPEEEPSGQEESGDSFSLDKDFGFVDFDDEVSDQVFHHSFLVFVFKSMLVGGERNN